MQIFNTTFTTAIREASSSGKVSSIFTTRVTRRSCAEKPQLIDQAIEGLLAGYNKNIFPEMKANWDAYPTHIGHIEFNGCFRCHNGSHESEDGQVISRDCNLCHTILAQGSDINYENTTLDMSLEFKHPVDIDEAWKEMACADCHRYLY